MMNKQEKELNKIFQKTLNQAEKQALKVYKNALNAIYVKVQDYQSKINEKEYIKTQMKRLDKIKREIVQEIANIYDTNADILYNALEEAFNIGYYGGWYNMEHQAHEVFKFDLISKETIKRLIENPVDAKKLSDRLWTTWNRNKKQMAKMSQVIIEGGLLAGMSHQDMALLLQNAWNSGVKGGYKAFLRIIRTEAHRVREGANYMQLKDAKGLGIETVDTWDSTLDKRTRNTHKNLDGKERDKNGYFHLGTIKAKYPGGFGIAKEDIHCRCVIVSRVKGLPLGNREKWSRNPFSGKKEVLQYKTYNAWFKDLQKKYK